MTKPANRLKRAYQAEEATAATSRLGVIATANCVLNTSFSTMSMRGLLKREQNHRLKSAERAVKTHNALHAKQKLDRPATMQETSAQKDGFRTGVTREEAYIEGEVHQREHIEEHELRHTHTLYVRLLHL